MKDITSVLGFSSAWRLSALVFLFSIGLASCSPSSSKSTNEHPYSPQRSTEFGKTLWTDYAVLGNDSPGSDFYIGAWTHTVEPMGYDTDPNAEGYTGTGNDYPFVIPCSETVGVYSQFILMISGNIGYDSGASSWSYNENITTATGDYATTYIYPGQYSGIEGHPDEAAMRGWVYVAWHYRSTASGTVVSQFAKFGPDGPVIATPEATINGMGGWSTPASPTPEFVTPVTIRVGGDSSRSARIYMQYAKVYVMAAAPSIADVDAIALLTSPDSSAWADWPLIGGDMHDVSGNGRDLSMNGSAGSGIDGPEL